MTLTRKSIGDVRTVVYVVLIVAAWVVSLVLGLICCGMWGRWAA